MAEIADSLGKDITIPGINRKVPLWAFVGAAAAGLFVFLASKGKKDTSQDEDAYLKYLAALARMQEYITYVLGGAQNGNQDGLNPPGYTPPGNLVPADKRGYGSLILGYPGYVRIDPVTGGVLQSGSNPTTSGGTSGDIYALGAYQTGNEPPPEEDI